jgi:hypothetical protein
MVISYVLTIHMPSKHRCFTKEKQEMTRNRKHMGW